MQTSLSFEKHSKFKFAHTKNNNQNILKKNYKFKFRTHTQPASHNICKISITCEKKKVER